MSAFDGELEEVGGNCNNYLGSEEGRFARCSTFDVRFHPATPNRTVCRVMVFTYII